MALPRYDAPEVTLQPGAAASAYQAQAQTWNVLSQKLDQFRGIAFQELSQIKAQEAEQQAIKDQIEGKPFYQESVYTIYGQAYNETRKATYTAQTELDLQEKSKEFATQFANDPESYKNSMSQYIKTTQEETKIPEIDLAIGLSGRKLLESQYIKLNDKLIKKEKETQLAIFNKYAQQQQTALINAIVAGDTKAATLIRDSLDEYTTSMMEDKVLDDATFIEYYDAFEFGVKRGVVENSMTKLLEENKYNEAQKLYDDFSKEIPEGYTQDQYRTVKSRLATTLNSAKKAIKTQQKELKINANQTLQDAIDILNTGKIPSFAITKSTLAYATPSKLEKYSLAKEAQARTAEISNLTIQEQEVEVNKYKANPKASKLDTKVIKQMESNLNERKAMWRKDPITQGVVELKNEDIIIDFTKSTILDDLKARNKQRIKNEDEAGPTAWKLLKESEAIDLANMLNNPETPLKDKQTILETVNDAGSEIANRIYRQVGEKKAHTFSYAGRLTSMNNSNAALIALQGNGADVKLEEGTKQDIQSKLQGVFRFSPAEEYNTMLKGTLDYIKGKIISDSTYEIDINEVLEETIGKVEKYNGSNVVLPFGVTTDKFENWLDNIDFDKEELPKEVQEDLKDMTDFFGSGDVQLHRVENGKYRIFYTNGGNGFYQADSTGKKAYILEYK